MKILLKSLLEIFLVFLLFTSSYAEINLQFTSQRYLSNPRFAGLSNTGVALPDALPSTIINPSLVHYWHWKNKTTYSGSLSYERDSIFSEHIINSGVSWYINEKTTIGTLYRYLKKSSSRQQNEMVMNISGKLFDKSLDQGAVNIGVNIRYEDLKWRFSDLDSLKILYYRNDTLTNTVVYPPPDIYRMIEESRLLFDLGFFQDNIFPGLDFGLTFHNLLGRVWKSENPVKRNIIDTIHDSLFVDSSYYSIEWVKSKNRNKKIFKRMTVGVTYHLKAIQNKIELITPFDLEFIGLFDKDKDIKVAIHTGIEGWLNEKICLRFGYARTPTYIYGRTENLSITYNNLISGGAGVRFKRILFDVYMRKENWGIGTSVAF